MMDSIYTQTFSKLCKIISRIKVHQNTYSILSCQKQVLINKRSVLRRISFHNGMCERRHVSSDTEENSESWLQHYGDLLLQIKTKGIESLEDKYLPVKRTKRKADGVTATLFVDYCKVKVLGGNGGSGCANLQQLFLNANAGPAGGDGGNGGHVLFKATSKKRSLHGIGAVVKAKAGENGKSKSCTGKGAPDTVVEVPLGTIFKRGDSVICHLEDEGDLFVAARGGAGGKGNIFFANSVDQAPMVAELGGEGEYFTYEVELRLIADIGLIGFPNAGKSTLLRAVSRARPKVASYPFTTLNPHVGMVNFKDHHQIAIADIPGLIKGSHSDLGLGIDFLKHIQRCGCLLYVLDASQEDAVEQLNVLRNELECYEAGLSQRPQAIVLNKIDLPEVQNKLATLEQNLDLPTIPISAKLGQNLVPLLAVMRFVSEQHRNQP